jgi:hypothetical protein
MSDEPRARDLLADPASFPVAGKTLRWEAPMTRQEELRTIVRPTMPTTLFVERPAVVLELRERELPPQLFQDLRMVVPQALLRDLHRPVQEFYVQPEIREGTQVTGLLDDELARVRAARRLPARPTVEPSVVAINEVSAHHHALLHEPWQPLQSDEAPRRRIELYPTFDADGNVAEPPPRFEPLA